jgi:hypothetical protein
MSEYRVTYSEVPAQCEAYGVSYSEAHPECEDYEPEQLYSGLLLHIRPPVPSLNPDAVERYLSNGAFEPINSDLSDADTKDVVLLGNTLEQTTIYASIKSEQKDYLIERRLIDTVKLLQFMGATAMIDQPPIPN